MKKMTLLMCLLSFLFIMPSCKKKVKEENTDAQLKGIDMENRLAKYIDVPLKSDLSKLTEKEKQMLPLLFEVADIMDELFWLNAYGEKEELLSKTKDEQLLKYLNINYGPWDRLDNDVPFIEGIGEKPKGANFYPADITEDEFKKLNDPLKESLYSVIRRDENGALKVIPFHVEYKEQLTRAHDLLIQASELAEDKGLQNYLQLVAKALITDNYFESDMAWLDMKNNTIDFVTGAIETYEDALYGYRASYESYILIKDHDWSKKLAKYTQFLPELQKSLPVDQKYKNEKPGVDGELNVYDVVYYTGHCNAGSKTIAINLPNDPKVQMEKGSRKLQLKNAMKAKFDHILVPIANNLIEESQRGNINFDAFFTTTMFHEVAHGLGIKYLVNDPSKEVKATLKETATTLEEAKADILGLYMITYLYNKGELKEISLEDYYITFVASMFRSIRFGQASSHGKANMMRFNYLLEKGALVRNAEKGTYKVDIDKMKVAVVEIGKEILIVQGNGDYEKAKAWVNKDAVVKTELQSDLDRLDGAKIPTDIYFIQGPEVLGLSK